MLKASMSWLHLTFLTSLLHFFTWSITLLYQISHGLKMDYKGDNDDDDELVFYISFKVLIHTETMNQ